MDSGGASQGIRGSHSCNKDGDLGDDGGGPRMVRPWSVAQCSRKRRRPHRSTVSRATITRASRHPAPDPGQPDSEEPIAPAKLGPARRPCVCTASCWRRARFS